MFVLIENLFFIQLVGCVSCGGFIGEYYRKVTAAPEDNLNLKLFIAHFLAGSFLAFVVAYAVYLTSKQKELSLILGALLSYQDEQRLNKITRSIISEHLGKGGRNDE